MKRGTAWVTAVLVTTAVADVALRPPSAAAAKNAPARKAGAAAKAPSLNSAIEELKREYAAFVKDPDGAPLRSECDYFIDHPQTVAATSLLTVLEKPMPGDA